MSSVEFGTRSCIPTFTVMLAGTILFLVPSAGASPPSTTELKGYWPLDEMSGSTAADASGNGNTGTLNGANGLPVWTSGQINGALAFDGTDDAVQIANEPNFDFGTGDFTLAVWAKINLPDTGFGDFIAKGVVGACCNADGYPGYELGEYYNTIAFRLEDTDTAGANGRNTVEVSVSAAPYIGAWHHYAAVRSGNTASLYIDGVLVASNSTTLSAAYNTNNDFPLALGARIYWTTADVLKGSLDDARVYNRALSPSEVADLYTFGAVPPVLSNGKPSENLLADTIATTLSVTTNENATCRYGTVPNTAYASLPNVFTSTGSLTHSATLSGLTSGGSYTYYVRCSDAGGKATTSDYPISFSVYPKPATFRVYDMLGYSGKPDLTPYGLRKDWIVYAQELWPAADAMTEPNQLYDRRTAGFIAKSGWNDVLQLDVEHWPLDIRSTSTAVVDDSLRKLQQQLSHMRSVVPFLRYGYYDLPTIRDYWTPVINDPANMAKWKAANDYIASLTQQFNDFYPSLYTFYNDPAGWVVYARANLSESKRQNGGTPVYVYLWPQYHDSSPLAFQFIDYDYWKLQLQTVKDAGADGVVIWSGGGTWDDTWGWWQATKEFMSTEFMSTLPGDTVLPSTPSDLTATRVSSSQVDLSWNASTDNSGTVAEYRVYRCSGVFCFPTTQMASPATTSYSDAAASDLVAYFYRVAAVDPSGNISQLTRSAAIVPTTTGPLGHWRLDESWGATASDASGSV